MVEKRGTYTGRPRAKEYAAKFWPSLSLRQFRTLVKPEFGVLKPWRCDQWEVFQRRMVELRTHRKLHTPTRLDQPLVHKEKYNAGMLAHCLS